MDQIEPTGSLASSTTATVRFLGGPSGGRRKDVRAAMASVGSQDKTSGNAGGRIEARFDRKVCTGLEGCERRGYLWTLHRIAKCH